MEKQFLYQKKKIFYRVSGHGKPVILIHGFGEDGAIWNHQETFLKKNYKLIIPDLPGSGYSAMIEDMSMEGIAEVIHAIIHEEGGDTYTIIGHSMGGYVLLALLEKYPTHINSFGLFHSTAFADSKEKKATRRKGIEFINQHGAFEFLKTTTPNLFSQKTKEEQPEIIEKLIAASHNFLPAALVSYYNAMIQRPDRTSLLTECKVPVLFILGKYDVAVPLEDSLKLCHLPEKSYIHILSQTGHIGMLEEPGNSNRILENFLLEN